MSVITKSEASRLEAALRRILASPSLTLRLPPRAGQSVEIAVSNEIVGTIHRDEDEGEISYAVHMTLLEEDLTPEGV